MPALLNITSMRPNSSEAALDELVALVGVAHVDGHGDGAAAKGAYLRGGLLVLLGEQVAA